MELPVLDAAETGHGCPVHGSPPGTLSYLPDRIRARIQDHPCYSEQAHHYFARMHLAVAPACNIQCNYCNRKYDCANESRPGVASELLSPEQAARKALAVAAVIPQLSVVGIAGPGDPLANPERTFETFRQIARKAPDIKLCLSTNGLNLPCYLDEIVRCNIGHVTITINCLDPEIGARIYPWIYWERRRIRGAEGAAILIEQQQKGLEMLHERGILVKVNSVMIPGVNDAHLKEVSRAVKAKGAFLHNIMPLIAEAAHGSYYGIMGWRVPDAASLRALQDECAGSMAMMRHCRRCRADAVGMLGEDRGAEFSLDKLSEEVDYEAAMARRKTVRANIAAQLEARRAAAPELVHIPLYAGAPLASVSASRPVRMAVASVGGDFIDLHFGHAREFLIYDVSAAGARFAGRRKVGLYCIGGEACGEEGENGRSAESVLARTIAALKDCEAMLCARIGYEPRSRLEEAGIMPDGEHAMEPIEDAVMAVYGEMLANERLSFRAAPRWGGGAPENLSVS
jgi:nitrogen fixation protein NifB